MFIFTVLGWLLFGLLAGAIARFVLPGKQQMSLLMTMVLGVIGSFVGGGIWHLLFASGNEFQPGGWILSIIGAVLVLLAYGAVTTKKGVASRR